MKFWKISLFALVLFVAACDDDEVICLQSDWTGTYDGTADCDGTVEGATVTITPSGTANIIIDYVTPTTTTTYDPLPFDGCSLVNTASGGGFEVALDASLNGDEITIVETITVGPNSSVCRVVATRN